jgi:hypothetical protein
MFKLVKIRGARTSIPEIVSYNIDQFSSYEAGAFYYISNDTVSTDFTYEHDLKFIPIETIPKNSGRTTVRGFIVTPEMVFETKICNYQGDVGLGDLLSTCDHADVSSVHVEGSIGESALLLSKDGVEKTGKVLVALKW